MYLERVKMWEKLISLQLTSPSLNFDAEMGLILFLQAAFLLKSSSFHVRSPFWSELWTECRRLFIFFPPIPSPPETELTEVHFQHFQSAPVFERSIGKALTGALRHNHGTIKIISQRLLVARKAIFLPYNRVELSD